MNKAAFDVVEYTPMNVYSSKVNHLAFEDSSEEYCSEESESESSES